MPVPSALPTHPATMDRRRGLTHAARPAGGRGVAWIDFAAVSAYVGPMSPPERRVLLFAASLSDVDAAPAVRLGDLTRVGPRRMELLIAALRHAGGQRDAWQERARAGG